MGKRIIKGTISTVLGGLAFVILHYVFNIRIDVSTAIAIVVYVVMKLMTGSIDKPPAPRAAPVHAPDHFLWNTIEEGKEKLKGIGSMKDRIPDGEVKDKVADLCRIGDRIMERLQREPKDARLIRSFFSYYLDAAYNILTKYLDLSANSTEPIPPDTAEAKRKTDSVLDLLRSQFQEALTKLDQDYAYDLDSEIAALERIVAAEGTRR